MDFSPEYWDDFFKKGKLGWDIGYVSPPLKEYFDQLENKDLKILVPGAGSGWEVEYLYKNGFNNTYLLDFSQEAIKRFKKRFPGFPGKNIIREDFFKHNGKYDLIVEQTFFTSFHPSKREKYVNKIHELLNENGKLVGVFFNKIFGYDGPPFGGTKEEYKHLFSNKFIFRYIDDCYNSIKPRNGSELFILALKR